jgi:hypothetical protein
MTGPASTGSGQIRCPRVGCRPAPATRGRDDAGRAALVCYRELELNEITFWHDLAEAQEAARELVPCSSACANVHAVAFSDAGRIRTEPQRASMVLVAVVVEASWHGANHRRLVACPWCGGEHSHPLRHVGLVRPSGCLKGFYEIKREDEEP